MVLDSFPCCPNHPCESEHVLGCLLNKLDESVCQLWFFIVFCLFVCLFFFKTYWAAENAQAVTDSGDSSTSLGAVGRALWFRAKDIPETGSQLAFFKRCFVISQASNLFTPKQMVFTFIKQIREEKRYGEVYRILLACYML